MRRRQLRIKPEKIRVDVIGGSICTLLVDDLLWQAAGAAEEHRQGLIFFLLIIDCVKEALTRDHRATDTKAKLLSGWRTLDSHKIFRSKFLVSQVVEP